MELRITLIDPDGALAVLLAHYRCSTRRIVCALAGRPCPRR